MKIKNALISANNLSVIKNEKTILKNIDIEINKNDFLTIIGPNGAGKTTSMRIITGYLRSNGGSVLINNKNIGQNPIYTKSMIGYLPEGVPLYLDFSPYLYLD
jgi:ABC-2 type transport system ATP-binding protein